MKKLKLIPIFLFGIIGLFAQNYVDIQQDRIDMLDGVKDQNVSYGNFSDRYFTQIDIIQEQLLDSNFTQEFKDEVELALYYDLYYVNERTLKSQRKGPEYYDMLEQYLNQSRKGKAELYLAANLPLAYDIFRFIGEDEAVRKLLEKEAVIHPEQVLKNYPKISQISYAKHILSLAVRQDPIAAKNYFNGSHPIHVDLTSSTDSLDQLILKIYKDSNKPSLSLSLLQEIANGNLSIEQADKLAKLENELFLDALIKLVPEKNVLAKKSIDNLLHTICTKKVREVNGEHEQHNEAIRFADFEKYESPALYNFIIYSQEEIFTSSFNGIFKMLMKNKKAEGLSSFDLLEKVKFNELRTFLKMSASFAALDEFLADLNNEEKAALFHKFIKLEPNNDLLREAVSIADAIGSVTDSTSNYYIENELFNQYQETTRQEEKVLYTLLIQLFVDKATVHQAAFQKIAAIYPKQSLTKIDEPSLFGTDGTHSQLHLFYAGDDGESSYASFMSLWRNSKWKIEDLGSFVVIRNSTGKSVQIAANKPNHDTNGPIEILAYFEQQNAEIEVLVHRGHSFYVSKSLAHLQAEMKVILLGSCGGYNQVLNVLNQAPNAQIVSTKQIGSYTVNNPLIYQLASEINQGKELDWEIFWTTLSGKFQKGTYAFNKFNEYVPPHKNLGAAFIQAYREIVN